MSSPSIPGAPTVRKAVLLAAGRGTRMRELTLDVPKPMLPVRGKPILEHIVTGLQHAGVEEVLIIVGYRADVVQDHFGDGAGFGLGIRYEHQVTQDGTGRVVELARPFVADTTNGHRPADGFILSYGDILIDPTNYRVLTSPGEDEEGIVTVKHSDDVSKGGAVFVNARFDLVDLREKPKPGEPTSPWYNAGVYFFRPSLFEFTARLQKSVRGEYELTDAIRDLAQSGRRVRACELSGEWADVRDPEILAELDRRDSGI